MSYESEKLMVTFPHDPTMATSDAASSISVTGKWILLWTELIANIYQSVSAHLQFEKPHNCNELQIFLHPEY